VFASQFMSILIAKLFEADMTNFTFVFSQSACVKTCIYFAVMYFAVMIFNTITISRYKLINLINAIKKNEMVKIRNPILSVLIFIIACGILGYAYWKVTAGVQTMDTADKLLPPIIMGIVSTVLIFWSLSGFVLQVIKSSKNIYLKNTNMFVLRQLNNKINTTVISMSVICLMLFMTITVLSSSLSLKNTMQKDLIELTPVDLNLYKSADLPERVVNKYGKEIVYTKEQIEDSKITIQETLKNNGLDMDILKDLVEISVYTDKELNIEKFLGNKLDEIKSQYPLIAYNTDEMIVKISDYNKIAKLYGIEQYELNDDEFIVICDFDGFETIRNIALKNDNRIKISGKQYKPKYDECKDGYIIMTPSHMNTGIILVPDNCKLTNKDQHFLAANYNAITDEEKEEIEKMFSNNSEFIQKLNDKGIIIDGNSKIAIIESSVGIATIVTFVAIYLGIIFLIASAAILALKQLTESSDNKQRYMILRKIGCDEKMINKALFRQIAIFFALPLILAIIHAVFGIQFVLAILSGIASAEELLPSIIATVAIMGLIYGSYFLATYFGSKSIIKEEIT